MMVLLTIERPVCVCARASVPGCSWPRSPCSLCRSVLLCPSWFSAWCGWLLWPQMHCWRPTPAPETTGSNTKLSIQQADVTGATSKTIVCKRTETCSESLINPHGSISVIKVASSHHVEKHENQKVDFLHYNVLFTVCFKSNMFGAVYWNISSLVCFGSYRLTAVWGLGSFSLVQGKCDVLHS